MEAGEQRILRLESQPREARRAALFCRHAADEHFSFEDCNLVELAVAEAYTNILRHAYKGQHDRPIWVTIAREADGLAFLLEDEAGVGFDPASAPLRVTEFAAVNDVPEGGWGLLIIRKAMDEVAYTVHAGRNQLRLVKHFVADEVTRLGPTDTAQTAAAPALARQLQRLRQEFATNEQALAEMSQELSNAYESLNTFYTFSREVNTLTDEAALVRRILETLTVAVDARWAVLRVSGEQGLRFRAGVGLSRPVPENMVLTDSGVEGRVACSGQEVVSADADGTPLLGLPIMGLDRFLGTILLGGTEEGGSFSAGDAKLARGLADQAAVTLENHRMLREVMAARLARQELDIAHDLQQRLYPTTVPDIRGLRLFAEGVAARRVGGDYIALLLRADGCLDFVIADAMGKGMPAAFFSILSHVAFRSLQELAPDRSPAEMMDLFHRIMTPDLERFDMYMTALCGRVDLRDDSLTYASAGHCPLLLAGPDGACRFAETLDFMLGVDLTIRHQQRRIAFPPGTRILAYTDGFTDVVNASGQMEGSDALLAFWTAHATEPVDDVCRALLAAAVLRAGDADLQDDVALIGIERLCTPAPIP